MAQVQWTREDIEFVLSDKQWLSEVKDDVVNDNGVRFILKDGTPVDWWPSTGRVRVQGKTTDIKAEAHEIFSDPFSSYVPKRKVFIAYGHDEDVKTLLSNTIVGFGLEPVLLDQIASGGNTIIEQLEEQMEDAAFACVLLTPDDKGYPKCKPAEKKYRARQNVILELGMVVGKLGRKNVAVFLKGDLEKPSDIHGLIYIPLENEDDARKSLKANLEKAGVKVSAQSGN